MFARKSEGVYEFGTKRIYVKIERGRIQIRVGGGYLSIDEFIDQYTPLELDIQMRTNPMERLTQVVDVQKRCIRHERNEWSPIRRSMSPPIRKIMRPYTAGPG